jgi:hypothetical protein
MSVFPFLIRKPALHLGQALATGFDQEMNRQSLLEQE